MRHCCFGPCALPIQMIWVIVLTSMLHVYAMSNAHNLAFSGPDQILRTPDMSLSPVWPAPSLLGSLPSRRTVIVMSSLYRREYGAGIDRRADTCSLRAPPSAFLTSQCQLLCAHDKQTSLPYQVRADVRILEAVPLPLRSLAAWLVRTYETARRTSNSNVAQ